MTKILGTPVVRTDAVAKVTGQAAYVADHTPAGTLHAALATGTISRGRITAIDAGGAERLPGVRLVLTHRNLGDAVKEGQFLTPVLGGQFQTSFNPLGSDEIRYSGQIVALAVADTPEIAEEAARLIRVEYEEVPAVIALADLAPDAPGRIDLHGLQTGDTATALAESHVVVDREYATSVNHHNPIEPFHAAALWQDGRLEIRVPSQWVTGERFALAGALGVTEEDVRVVSPYVGGGFGSKGATLWHTVLTAEAARRLDAPVKLSITRRQMFTIASFRPESRHWVRLAATSDGRFTAYEHEVLTQTSRSDVLALPGTDNTARLYAFPNIHTRESTIGVDVNTPGFMRGPLEYPELFALESAVDELAMVLDVDPMELRLRNEPAKEPVEGLRYSSRSLQECYRRGAELFGWHRRRARPGSMRDSDGTLIGWGCASASYPVFEGGVCDSRITVGSDGRALVEVASQDIGTGTYTLLAQIAAETSGLALADVRVALGDSDLPRGLATAASSTTGTVGAAVHENARSVREQLLAAAAVRFGRPRAVEDLTISDGVVRAGDGLRITVAELVADLPRGVLAVEIRHTPPRLPAEMAQTTLRDGTFNITGPARPDHVAFSYGANFAEVRVDPVTRQVRMGRMVGVFAVGRVLNPRIAHGLLAGGMIWGAGHALMEKTVMDRDRARFVNTDLAGYHIAANADISDVIVETVDEHDDLVNVLGAKGGVGEMGIVAMPAAIANAVFHATGVRVRRLPILVDDLLIG
ncbi:xanthine dehydrogenase family protein molybdopterin-binding subunit [Herbidospora mongoliensis]|uniref:xanthine dehydrogenase family protein molybdopterin-binding subunit n=1 Tax=Herbidospora mongoliensis TaxID=688067 RepID=UPI00082D39B7|nr:xanthine dehydrogenase family protein molybdopterin-binding subunit [Herbidospora mongoliensis]